MRAVTSCSQLTKILFYRLNQFNHHKCEHTLFLDKCVADKDRGNGMLDCVWISRSLLCPEEKVPWNIKLCDLQGLNF